MGGGNVKNKAINDSIGVYPIINIYFKKIQYFALF